MDLVRILSKISIAVVCALAVVAQPMPATAQTALINNQESATPYASVRGWSVVSVGDGRGITGCRAVRGSGYDENIILQFDAFSGSWEILIRAVRPSGGGLGIKGAAVYWDGKLTDSQVGFGIPGADGSSDTHARLPLSVHDLRAFMKGSFVEIDISGETSRRFALKGTTAAALKVEECVERFLGSVSPRPSQL